MSLEEKLKPTIITDGRFEVSSQRIRILYILSSYTDYQIKSLNGQWLLTDLQRKAIYETGMLCNIDYPIKIHKKEVPRFKRLYNELKDYLDEKTKYEGNLLDRKNSSEFSAGVFGNIAFYTFKRNVKRIERKGDKIKRKTVPEVDYSHYGGL